MKKRLFLSRSENTKETASKTNKTKPVNKTPTTLTEMQKVEQWIDKKRGEQVELRRDFKITHDMKIMGRITKLCSHICLAEQWLACRRVTEFLAK